MTDPITRPPEVMRRWTVEALFDVPADPYRYELYHGTLLVSPPPDTFHGRAATDLHRVLQAAAPPGLFVTSAGIGIYVSDTTYYIPDVLVVPRTAVEVRARGVRPADVRLAVEVVSPSNSRQDLVLKRDEYAAAGIPLYWIVDPDHARLTVFRLRPGAGRYGAAGVVRHGGLVTAEEPFPVTFRLADIVPSGTG
jgi:Uma2 family endonuclease